MAVRTPEQKDLDFIELVDFRIADYSNNEKKLQAYLKTNLVPLLEKARNVMLVQRKVGLSRTGGETGDMSCI